MIFVLAQLTREELARSFRQGFDRGPSSLALLMVFAAALAAALIWAYWRNRTAPWDGTAATPSPIFHDIARSLSLSLADRWLLMRITRHEALPTPVTLLICPRTLRHHARAYGHSLAPFRRRRLTRRICRLRHQIFGNW